MFLSFTRQRSVTPRRPPPRASLGKDDAQVVLGCGWFDSSHDLQHGLQATELRPEDPLPAALALEICLKA